MQGTMMNFPLTLATILERAGKYFGKVEIVSQRPDRSLHRCTYADFYRRTRALAEGLTAAGLTSVGKFLKSKLRQQYAHWRWEQ